MKKARLGKEELLAKTVHLHDPFPFTLRLDRVHNPVILLDLIFKHLEGSEHHNESCSVDFTDQLFSRLGSVTSCIYIMYSNCTFS